MKIRLVGPELFKMEGRTDMTKLVVAFRNFANAPNKFYVLPTQCIYVFCVYLRTNSVYFTVHHYLTGLYN
jgi:hypothetical protein